MDDDLLLHTKLIASTPGNARLSGLFFWASTEEVKGAAQRPQAPVPGTKNASPKTGLSHPSAKALILKGATPCSTI
jgi:hypothetical protein